MGLDFANERYVRLYVRDTVTWKLFSWQARGLLCLALRKADRGGVLDCSGHGKRGLAALVEMPISEVEAAVRELLDAGSLIECERGFMFPNFVDAQESRQSAAQRQREKRLRDASLGVTKSDAPVTKRDATVTKRDATVTRRHTTSHGVTPSLAEPSLAEPSLAEPSLAENLTRACTLGEKGVQGETSAVLSGAADASPAPKASKRKSSKPKADDAPPPEGFAEVRDAYLAEFEARYGERPEFAARQGKALSELLRRHGRDAVLRKFAIAFHAPPPWPTTAWSLVQIAGHWDALVTRSANGIGQHRVTAFDEYDPPGIVEL